MEIALRSVGKPKGGAVRELCDLYIGRLVPVHLNWRQVPDATGEGLGRAQRESVALQQSLPTDAVVIALDRTGEQMTSEAFAAMVFEDFLGHARLPCFVIGGADGLSPDFLGRAQRRLSLGMMTFPHSLAAVMLLEQIYRAKTIWRGEPYHRA